MHSAYTELRSGRSMSRLLFNVCFWVLVFVSMADWASFRREAKSAGLRMASIMAHVMTGTEFAF